MGVVYGAFDLALHRKVAIKTLPRVSAEEAMRLRREARSMAAIAHPNLALILAAEAWHGIPMLVLEYLDGGTFSERVGRGGMSTADVVRVGSTIADVLVRIHAAGLLHRDIKPTNIGYTAEGVPKLLDFGLVKILGGTAQTAPIADASSQPTATWPHALENPSGSHARFVGTPGYLSPEAISGAPPDVRVDLWALALVMYEGITGRNPFLRSTLFETLDAIVKADLPHLRVAASGCPPRLADVLAGALARNPDHRPRSALEFKQAIDGAAVD
jgi:serine/threonine-protein kinase